jgi:hypothetical protein
MIRVIRILPEQVYHTIIECHYMNIKFVSYIILIHLPVTPLIAATLTLTFKPYPNVKQVLTNLKKPEKLAHLTLIRITEQAPISGIMGTYAGFMQASNEDGQMIFPRKQTNTQLFLLVTPEIEPVLMFPHTVKEWKLIPQKKYSYFNITRTTDPETELTYWNVEEAALDPQHAIQVETLILLAQPTDLVIPTGITLTNKEPNLQLPTIYSQNSLDTTLEALTAMNIAYLFKPVNQCSVKKNNYMAEQPCVP